MGQIRSRPSGVSAEWTLPDSSQKKMVRELTPDRIAASSVVMNRVTGNNLSDIAGNMIANGQVIGMTTSGDFGHSIGRSLVLGYVPREYFGQNTFEIEAFGERSAATRVEGCIYDPRHERVRA